MPLTLVLRRQRQADGLTFEASMVYKSEFWASQGYIIRLSQRFELRPKLRAESRGLR